MKYGSEKTFGAGYNVLPIWKDRLSAKTLITTPNSDVIYAIELRGTWRERGSLPGLGSVYSLKNNQRKSKDSVPAKVAKSSHAAERPAMVDFIERLQRPASWVA